MPFVPSEPSVTVVEVTVPTEHAIDEYHILGINIGKDPNDDESTSVDVTWVSGFRDDQGTFVVSTMTADTFTGPELAAKSLAEVNGVTLYDAIKTAAWELITAKHKLDGSIS
jgi:hypothetical protein